MKALGSLVLFIVVTLLLRSTALTALASRGILLDALAFATVVWALRHGEAWGTSFGFALGLAADLDAAHWLGRHALALALIGYVVGRGSFSLVRDSARTQAVLLFAATLVHQFWAGAFEFVPTGALVPLLSRALLAGLATAPVGALLLGVVRYVSGQPLFTHAGVDPGPTL